MEQPNEFDFSAMLQKSAEWIEARKGNFTASEFHRLMADAKRPMTQSELDERPKGSRTTTIVDPEILSDGAMTYILEVAGEILTGMSADSDYMNKAMEWGILHEPLARKLYSKVMGKEVKEVGMVKWKNSKYVCGSPDGLVGADGGIETKCPEKNARHLENLLLKDWRELKEKHNDYYWQCIGGILLAERKWWDFVSFSPNFNGTLKIKIIHIPIAEVMDDVRLLAIKLKSATKKLIEIVNPLLES